MNAKTEIIKESPAKSNFQFKKAKHSKSRTETVPSIEAKIIRLFPLSDMAKMFS